MRTRYLKPGFFENEQLAECSFAARLLFAGLWCLADKRGRLEDRPKKIKAQVLPYDAEDVNLLLQELIDNDLIIRYEKNEKNCLWVKTFLKHQRPHASEQKSELPMSDEELEMIRKGVLPAEDGMQLDVSMTADNVGERTLSSNVGLGDNDGAPRLTTEEHLGDNDGAPRCPFNFNLNLNLNSNSELELESGVNKNTNTSPQPVAAVAADAAHEPVQDCPHEEIIRLYHEILPMLPRVKVWTDARRSMLRTRWREDKARQCLDWWRRYFGLVAECDFLCGRCPPGKSGRTFTADLEWLIKPTNLPKVLEGRYKNREPVHAYQAAAKMGYDEAKRRLTESLRGRYAPLRDEIDIDGKVIA